MAAPLAGFAAVAATTAFWWAQPLLLLSSLAAIAVVPAYVGALLRRAAGSAAASDSADAARSRLYAGLGDGVRDSLKSVLRAGARLDRTDLSPEDAEILARMRLGARAALVQIDAMPTFAAIEAGEFAPETRCVRPLSACARRRRVAAARRRPIAAPRSACASTRACRTSCAAGRRHLRPASDRPRCRSDPRSRSARRVAVQLELVELAGEAVPARHLVRPQGAAPSACARTPASPSPVGSPERSAPA